MNKKIDKSKILILTNIITLLFVFNLNITKSKFIKNNTIQKTQIEDLTKKLDSKVKEVDAIKLKYKAQQNINEDEIKKIAESFFKAYFNFNYLNKDVVYENIKPYTTFYLQDKLTPKSSDEELGDSDVDYISRIDNIHLYYNAYEENTKASILGVMDHLIEVKGRGNPTPIILKVNLIYTSEGWKVDDLVFNEVFKNIENI